MGLDINLEKCITKKQYDYLDGLKSSYDQRGMWEQALKVPNVFFHVIDDETKISLSSYLKWVQDGETPVDDFEAIGMSEKDGWNFLGYEAVEEKLNPADDLYKFKNKKTGEEKKIKSAVIPFRMAPAKMIYTESIGYQRRGVETKFYNLFDEGKLTYFVVTKDVLDLLYSVIQDKYKDSFKRNIYDKFCIGENFITLSW